MVRKIRPQLDATVAGISCAVQPRSAGSPRAVQGKPLLSSLATVQYLAIPRVSRHRETSTTPTVIATTPAILVIVNGSDNRRAARITVTMG